VFANKHHVRWKTRNQIQLQHVAIDGCSYTLVVTNSFMSTKRRCSWRL